jgi:hypothetical protein
MENLRTSTLATRKKTILVLIFIINYTLLITNCFSQQWRVFTTSNSPLPSNSVGPIVVDRNNVKWIGSPNGMVRIEGNIWQIFDTTNTPLDTNRIFPMALDSLNNIWCIVWGKGIAKFDGTNWIIHNTSNSGLPSNTNATISIGLDNTKWISFPGLIKFDDVTWTWYNSTNSGLPTNAATNTAIEDQTKWIGMVVLSGGMAKFNDTNWVIYNTGNSGLPSNVINQIRIDQYGNKWICTYAGGLAKFNSMLNSWTVYNPSNSGIPSYDIFRISFRNGYQKMVVTEAEGISIFNDTTWQNFNTSNSPLPNNIVNDIKIDKNNNIWITTLGGIAIYNPNNIIGINNNEIIKIPKSFVLYQNYPNPFNPKTKISYELSKNTFVNLTVYNIEGKVISILVNKNQSKGAYTINYSAGKLATGIYFYNLKTNTYTETKKMILVK